MKGKIMEIMQQKNHQKSRELKMRFQERDGILLEAIQEYDGVVARRQIKSLFWKNKTLRAMEKRLAKLNQTGYIRWPEIQERKTYPIPEPIVWLDWRGALYLAGKQGITVTEPKIPNENQLRMLEKSLRSKGFSWMREPRWSQLKHDLCIVDIRLWIKESLNNVPDLSLEEWINESVFRSDTDYVDYQIKTREGKTFNKRKGVCPDGSFTLIDDHRRLKSEPFRARFLVEMDMATHDNPSFGLEKVLPGVAYIKSESFKKRFGNNSGRWLVVTTSPIRMRNLIQQTQASCGNESGLFLFTQFDNFMKRNFFTEPIWKQNNDEPPKPLIEKMMQ